MPAEELEKQDIALLNLRCAERLPGAEKLDIEQCLATLDQWAKRVRFETERHLYRVRDPRYAEHYRNSEAYFRASMMLQVLQEDCGVHYNHDRITDVDFTKSQDLFLHGMVGSDNGGTCVSMPVLYTAIGRRLGYPMCLTAAKAHLLCRWDDGKERFNIEGAGEGFTSYDDDHYMTWPKPISNAEIEAGHYLKSLSPGEELAVFLSARGHCLEDNGRTAEARVCYAQALTRRPDSPDYFAFLAHSLGVRRQSVPSAARRPVEPPLVYQPPDYHAPPPQPGGYSPYQASRPVVPGMVGTPPSNPHGTPNGSPDIGVWP